MLTYRALAERIKGRVEKIILGEADYFNST